MGKKAPEGSGPQRTQTMFGRVGKWFSSAADRVREEASFIAENCRENDVFSLATLKEVSAGIKESVEGALSVVNTGWHYATGRNVTASDLAVVGAGALGAAGVGYAALAPGTADAASLFVDSATGPVLIDLDSATETGLSTSLYPTTYGFSPSGFYDEVAGKLVITYKDSTGSTGSEGILVIDDVTGAPSSTIYPFGDDPGKIKRDPNTGSVSFGDDTASYLCTDYEDAATCTSYAYTDAWAFAVDESVTGRGVVVTPSGYDVIDLASGTSELSGLLSYGIDVTIDHNTGYAFVADFLGMQVLTINLNGGTPALEGIETFSYMPASLYSYENATGYTEIAIAGYYSATTIDFFEWDGSSLSSVGSETHADTIQPGDMMAVDDESSAVTMYVSNSYASETLGLDLGSHAWDGSSYGSSYGSPHLVIYIPDTATPDPCDAYGGDADGDGTCADSDCDDADGSVQTEIEGVADADGDGYADAYGSAVSFCATSLPSGYLDVVYATDCDDGNPSVHEEIEGVADDDGDGYGAATGAIEYFCSASLPSGYSTVAYATDCDDTTPLYWEYEDWYYDYDGDGYGENTAISACGPVGYYTAEIDSDCDDGNASAYPGAPEGCAATEEEAADLNCDTVVQPVCENDGDGDGYDEDEDCDDTDPDIHPGVDEHCDGVDEDCDEEIDEDAVDADEYCYDGDGDGFATADCVWACGPDGFYTVAAGGEVDFNDSDANSYPGATEIADGVDNNNDGHIDECLWVEGADWTPEANCTELEIETGAEVGAWAAEGGFYTLEINGDGEPIITFHGVEGEIEVVRGEEDVQFITGPEGGLAPWIAGSIGNVAFKNGKVTFTIIDEHDDAVHYGVIESQVDGIEREDEVRVYEGEIVVADMETGEIDEEQTTAEDVLAALEEGGDTDDDDSGQPETGDDDDTGTPTNPGGCAEGCNAAGSTPAGAVFLVSLLGGAISIRRRRERTATSLSEMTPDEAAAAFGRMIADRMSDRQ